MANGAKREAIKKYFKPDPPFPKGAGCLIILGLPLLAAKGFGLVLIAIGIIIIVSWSMRKPQRPSDSEMDGYIADDLSMAKDKSLQKASIDESELVGESVIVTGPRFWDTGGAEFLFRKGEDNILRFSPISVTVLHMTQNQVVSYQCCLDLTTGNYLNEGTDEYFYKDVVSVATKTDSKTVPTDKFGTIQLNAREAFVLTTSGGTAIEVVLKDPKLIEMMGGGNIPTTAAEKAIQVVRKMLREKKQG